MKHSLTGSPNTHPSLFDLLAESLGGGTRKDATERSPAADPAERSSALAPTMLERLERALWRSRQRGIERQLEGATDAADLEDRLRRLERSMFHRYY